MYIFLPSAATGLRGFQTGLDARTWAGLLPRLTQQEGTIVLPRFNVDYSASLVASLSALGMGVAFDQQRADLSGMVQLSGERAYISEVQHKTVMKVDEMGTLAAAVTSVGISTTAMPVASFTMVVNRPFFCAIRDETTGTLLFMGAITNPA
jgi:serpin B